jgi:hypothetical protein
MDGVLVGHVEVAVADGERAGDIDEDGVAQAGATHVTQPSVVCCSTFGNGFRDGLPGCSLQC